MNIKKLFSFGSLRKIYFFPMNWIFFYANRQTFFVVVASLFIAFHFWFCINLPSPYEYVSFLFLPMFEYAYCLYNVGVGIGPFVLKIKSLNWKMKFKKICISVISSRQNFHFIKGYIQRRWVNAKFYAINTTVGLLFSS